MAIFSFALCFYLTLIISQSVANHLVPRFQPQNQTNAVRHRPSFRPMKFSELFPAFSSLTSSRRSSMAIPGHQPINSMQGQNPFTFAGTFDQPYHERFTRRPQYQMPNSNKKPMQYSWPNAQLDKTMQRWPAASSHLFDPVGTNYPKQINASAQPVSLPQGSQSDIDGANIAAYETAVGPFTQHIPNKPDGFPTMTNANGESRYQMKSIKKRPWSGAFSQENNKQSLNQLANPSVGFANNQNMRSDNFNQASMIETYLRNLQHQGQPPRPGQGLSILEVGRDGRPIYNNPSMFPQFTHRAQVAMAITTMPTPVQPLKLMAPVNHNFGHSSFPVKPQIPTAGVPFRYYPSLPTQNKVHFPPVDSIPFKASTSKGLQSDKIPPGEWFPPLNTIFN